MFWVKEQLSDETTRGEEANTVGTARSAIDRVVVILTLLIFALIGCISPRQGGLRFDNVAPGVPMLPPALSLAGSGENGSIRMVAEVWESKHGTQIQQPPIAVQWPVAFTLPAQAAMTIRWQSVAAPAYIILMMYARGELNTQGIPEAQHVFGCTPTQAYHYPYYQ